MKSIQILGVIALTVVALIGVKYINRMSNQRILNIWSPRVPYSLDPLDYDALAHHICFRSVYATLVSDYKLGEMTGVLASKWWSDSDKMKWSFQIRDDVFFADGQRIMAKDVALSLNRVALLMKKAKSDSGLLENILGISELKAANELASGIGFDDNIVTLTFQKPVPDVLDKIGFGLYAIASTKDFDPVSGAWRNKKKIIGSGPYQVEAWTDTFLELKIRPDFPKKLLRMKPVERAIFRYSQDAIAGSDLVIDFDDSLAVDNSFKFFGPVKSAIRYVECEGWNNPGSICRDPLVRKSLRYAFYEKLNRIGFSTVKSFLPLAIKGISEFSIDPEYLNGVTTKSKTMTVAKMTPAYKAIANNSKMTAQEAFDAGMNFIAEKNGLQLETLIPNPAAPLAGKVDFRFRMTAILVDSPHHDITFMLKSDHGIRLPDENGEIKKYVSNESFSAQVVNKMLWDQAIVWPIGHMALGLWKKEDSIDLAAYNLILPPLDLQWIEWE